MANWPPVAVSAAIKAVAGLINAVPTDAFGEGSSSCESSSDHK